MKLSGVEHSIKFNSLISNWVLVLERSEDAGLPVRPIRLGAKRVVLATQEPQPQSRSLWYLSLLALVFTAILALALNLPKVEEPKITAISCKPLAVGDEILNDSNSNLVRDWNISLTQVSEMGNILFYKYSAKCRDTTQLGEMLLVKAGTGYKIKKLTPTKR